jgi:hypothetical protein
MPPLLHAKKEEEIVQKAFTEPNSRPLLTNRSATKPDTAISKVTQPSNLIVMLFATFLLTLEFTVLFDVIIVILTKKNKILFPV